MWIRITPRMLEAAQDDRSRSADLDEVTRDLVEEEPAGARPRGSPWWLCPSESPTTSHRMLFRAISRPPVEDHAGADVTLRSAAPAEGVAPSESGWWRFSATGAEAPPG